MKFETFDCPNCGYHSENPKIHWVREVRNPYFYRASYTEVECNRCGFIKDIPNEDEWTEAENRESYGK